MTEQIREIRSVRAIATAHHRGELVMLIIQRALSCNRGALLFEFPGGQLDWAQDDGTKTLTKWEDPRDAVIRETREEAGIVISGISRHPIWATKPRYFFDDAGRQCSIQTDFFGASIDAADNPNLDLDNIAGFDPAEVHAAFVRRPTEILDITAITPESRTALYEAHAALQLLGSGRF